jgi:tight adherence protein C
VRIDPYALAAMVLSAAAVASLVLGVRLFARMTNVVQRRLAAPADGATEAPARALLNDTRPGFFARLVAPLTALARPSREEEVARLRERLVRGGLRGANAMPLFLGGKVVLGLLLLGAALWVNHARVERVEPGLLLAIVAFAVGFYAPDVLLASRTRQRQAAIERGLPDALDLLVTCVEAGLGLDASLQRVAEEVRLPWPQLGGELQETFLEVKAGIPRVEGFRRLASRTGVQDLKSLSATLTQTELFGTSVALALRVQAEGIRVRRMQRAEERAAYVAVKMTIPLVVCIMPAMVTVVLGPAVVNIVETLIRQGIG